MLTQLLHQIILQKINWWWAKKILKTQFSPEDGKQEMKCWNIPLRYNNQEICYLIFDGWNYLQKNFRRKAKHPICLLKAGCPSFPGHLLSAIVFSKNIFHDSSSRAYRGWHKASKRCIFCLSGNPAAQRLCWKWLLQQQASWLLLRTCVLWLQINSVWLNWKGKATSYKIVFYDLYHNLNREDDFLPLPAPSATLIQLILFFSQCTLYGKT